MRYAPNVKYNCFPCSYVAAGCACESILSGDFTGSVMDRLREDGYATLNDMNTYIRKLLPVRKKVYYKRNERITLSEFLKSNTEKCVICVYGHYLYADGEDYWSFFDNDNDAVVCVWYLKDMHA